MRWCRDSDIGSTVSDKALLKGSSEMSERPGGLEVDEVEGRRRSCTEKFDRRDNRSDDTRLWVEPRSHSGSSDEPKEERDDWDAVL